MFGRAADDNENDPLAWLGPVASLLAGSRARGSAAPSSSVPTVMPQPQHAPQPRPMQSYEQRSAMERAGQRLARGRSKDSDDVEGDLLWHADYYGYAPPPEMDRQRLARQALAEHTAMQLMAGSAGRRHGG